MTDNKNNNKTMTEKELNDLANKIVLKITQLKSIEELFEHAKNGSPKTTGKFNSIELTEEYEAYGEIAKLLTLLNLFQEDEEYEKCNIIKQEIEELNAILDKYDEI